MKITKLLLSIVLIFSLISPVFADETCAYFFYGEGCPHCGKVLPDIEDANLNENVDIKIFEVYHDRENLQLLQSIYDKFGVPNDERGVPTLFIGEEYIIGGKISSVLDSKLEEHKGSSCEFISGEDGEEKELGNLSILTVIGAAFVDSINPCAIAVLLILLSALLASGKKKRALKAGLAFTASIYIAYFLFGLGLFSVIKISGLSYWFYKFIGVLAILIGLFNLKDFVKHGSLGFVMEIPMRWRPTLKKLLNKVTSPIGAFLMGFVVCLFELPCTGGPYLVILGLLAEKTTRMAAIPILLLYNAVFILPLIFVTFLVFSGFTSVEKANKWKEKNLRILHLIAGLIMLGLGIVIVAGII